MSTQLSFRSLIWNDAWENKRVPIVDLINLLRDAQDAGFTVATVGGSSDGLSSWLEVEKPDA